MSPTLRVSRVGVATRPGLCPIAKETAWAAPMLCTEYGLPMDGWIVSSTVYCCLFGGDVVFAWVILI